MVEFDCISCLKCGFISGTENRMAVWYRHEYANVSVLQFSSSFGFRVHGINEVLF